MSDENVALGKRWFEEVWNQKNGGAVPELLAADCVMHGISETGGDVRGPEEFLALHAKLLSAFPDMQFTLHDCFGAGDKIAVRCPLRFAPPPPSRAPQFRRRRQSSHAACTACRATPSPACRQEPGIPPARDHPR